MHYSALLVFFVFVNLSIKINDVIIYIIIKQIPCTIILNVYEANRPVVILAMFNDNITNAIDTIIIKNFVPILFIDLLEVSL